MATTLYGATVVQEGRNESDARYDSIGKNSEAFTSGDVVSVSSGLLLVNTGLLTTVGVTLKTQTMASDNQTVAKVYPSFVPVDASTIFLMGSNGDLSVTAGPGTYYGLTGATGVQQIDQGSGVTTGASRIVEIVKVDPFNEGGTGSGSGLRKAYVRFVKTPYSNVSITT